MAEVGVDEGRLRTLAGQESAALEVQPRQIREAEIALVEGGFGQGRAPGERLREGRLVEPGAAKTAFDCPHVVEIAALERARRKVAFGRLRALHVAKSEGAAFLLLHIEQGATVKLRVAQFAAEETRRLERPFLENRPRKIHSTHPRPPKPPP